MDAVQITKITLSPRADIAYITVLLPNVSEPQKLWCATEFLGDLEFSKGQLLSPEQFDQLLKTDAHTRAVQKGLSLLDFGDHTKRGMCSKLRERGHDRESAEFAAEYLEGKRYIREDDYMRRLIAKYYKKGYGPSRIKSELYKKGFDRELFSTVFEEECAELDFALPASEFIEKKGGLYALSDKDERQKLYAALMRRGFFLQHIRDAVEIIKNGTNE